VTDRDGMYVHVTAKGAMSFRMDYRLNGRRETIYLGKYGPDGMSLARAREKCIDARRNIAARYSHCPKDLCRKLAVLLPSRVARDRPDRWRRDLFKLFVEQNSNRTRPVGTLTVVLFWLYPVPVASGVKVRNPTIMVQGSRRSDVRFRDTTNVG
jgi:Arm DNA-binding domain